MLIFIVTFLAWLSFIPEMLQGRYISIVKYLLLSLLLISLFRHRFRLREYFFSKEDIFIWIYFVLLSVGLINAAERGIAIDYYRNLVILGGSLYFLTKHTINRENRRIILQFLVIFSFMVALIGILEMIFGENIIYEKYFSNYYYERFIYEKRMMSTLMHPNILGCYLLACAPLAYYFHLDSMTRIKKSIYLVIFIVLIISLFLTFSRGTWVAALLTLSVYMLFRNKKNMLIVIWGGFLIFTVLVSFLPDSYFKNRFSAPNLIRYMLFEHRTVQYFVTANMLKKYPFAGVGLKNYREVFANYSDKKLYPEIRTPDSIYLMHLAESGIIGFLGFFMLLFIVLKRGFLLLRKSADRRGPFLFIFLSFIALLFNMASFDGFLWYTPFCLFWIFVAILCGIVKGESYNENSNCEFNRSVKIEIAPPSLYIE